MENQRNGIALWRLRSAKLQLRARRPRRLALVRNSMRARALPQPILVPDRRAALRPVTSLSAPRRVASRRALVICVSGQALVSTLNSSRFYHSGCALPTLAFGRPRWRRPVAS